MAIISSYPKDSNISLSDKLLGTDAESSLATKNFEIGDFIVFLGTQNIGTQGPIGPQGVQGNTGANGAVGPAGLTWRGAWVSGTAYATNDAVGYNGASWFCISAITGTTPPNANPTNWALLASQGAQGPQGVQGPTGPQGGVGIVPNAQEGVKGIASLASTVEVGQGINGTNIVTPVKLKAVLDLKENLSNKSTNIELGTSDTLYPTQNAVKSYVDANVGGLPYKTIVYTLSFTIDGSANDGVIYDDLTEFISLVPVSTGIYELISDTTVFTSNKTVIPPFGYQGTTTNSGSVRLPIFNFGILAGYYWAQRITSTIIRFSFIDTTGAFVNPYSILSNRTLQFEIKVYN